MFQNHEIHMLLYQTIYLLKHKNFFLNNSFNTTFSVEITVIYMLPLLYIVYNSIKSIYYVNYYEM